MQKWSEYFSYLDSPDGAIVCFLVNKKIPLAAMKRDFLSSITVDEGRRLFHTIEDNLRTSYKLCVVMAEAHFLASKGENKSAKELIDSVLLDEDYNKVVDYDINLVSRKIV